MDTKSLMVDIATKLFQEKGYKAVGLTEILNACTITKGAFYHHFPNGKEELLIACLHSLSDTITTDILFIFRQHLSTLEATHAMITGYTFSSVVSEMASFSEPVRYACEGLYDKIQKIYYGKLVTDGFSDAAPSNISLFMTASIEGAMMLCLTKKSPEPLRMTSKILIEGVLTRE